MIDTREMFIRIRKGIDIQRENYGRNREKVE